MLIEIYGANKMDQDVIRKSCKLNAANDVEYAELYGWNTEFIGSLQKRPEKGEHIYNFMLERVQRDHKIGSVHQIEENNLCERNLMIAALEHDFGILDFCLC